jgi:hypothetical protein
MGREINGVPKRIEAVCMEMGRGRRDKKGRREICVNKWAEYKGDNRKDNPNAKKRGRGGRERNHVRTSLKKLLHIHAFQLIEVLKHQPDKSFRPFKKRQESVYVTRLEGKKTSVGRHANDENR